MKPFRTTTANLLVKLAALFGHRAIMLDREASGIIMQPGGPMLLQPDLNSDTWRFDTTLANTIFAGALSVVVREHEANPTLAEAIYLSCVDLGLNRDIADRMVHDLIGPHALIPAPPAGAMIEVPVLGIEDQAS